MSRFRIGILYSTEGPYAALGRDCRDGVALAMHDLRAEVPQANDIELVFGDPGGDSSRYLDLARTMLRDRGCRHIVGTITSLSRKDVIPLIEKHDGLLWYVCPYEGFEANENVIYTGGCPNQHLLPLFDYLLPRHGLRAYLIGANYVWGWEMNRLARELLMQAGGEVLGERYLPFEETNVERLIADIAQRRPAFILNNLIGPASYAFFVAMRQLADRDPHFRPENCPIVSCDLTECELVNIPAGTAAGHLSAASYFDSLATPHNLAFKKKVEAFFGPGRQISTFLASAYAAVRLCGETILTQEDDNPLVVRRAIEDAPVDTILGPLSIDPRTNHAALPFHLGRINETGGFDIIASKPAIVADPYLIGERTGGQRHLRLVR